MYSVVCIYEKFVLLYLICMLNWTTRYFQHIFLCIISSFSFGMEHDGLGNECKYAINDDRYIMSPTQSLSNHPYMWSSCSRAYIRKFLL